MTHEISRRTLLRNLAAAPQREVLAPRSDGFPALQAEEREGNGGRAAMFRIARAFMNKYDGSGTFYLHYP